MAISLTTPRSAPGVSLSDIGQWVSGHVLHHEVIPWTEFAPDGKGGPKIGKDGKPRNQLRLTLRVVAGDATVKDGDGHRTVEKDEEVTVYLRGHRWGAWIETTRKAGANVGDIATIRYDRNEAGQVRGTTKHVWTVAIDKGVPDATRAECESRYHELDASAKDRKRNPGAAQDEAQDEGGDDGIPF